GVLFIVLSAVSGVLSWIFYFMALKKGNVSQVVAVDRSSVIIAIILSVLILGEKLTLKTGLAVILVFIGLLLLTI
ncbi:MAG TPA: EamA family transporter, partial [Thermoproteales archaeon]|nr:EamA family transporter [Thermoproteales archaeon]